MAEGGRRKADEADEADKADKTDKADEAAEMNMLRTGSGEAGAI